MSAANALARCEPEFFSSPVISAQVRSPPSGTKIESQRARLLTLGLNHLTWYRGFTVDGEDLWPRILERYITELKQDPDPEWTPRLIESLRSIPRLSSVRIILCSTQDERRRGMSLGATAYLVKPILPTALLDTLRQVLES